MHNWCTPQEMNQKKQNVLEGKDERFQSLSDLLLFIEKKFPELLKEEVDIEVWRDGILMNII